MCRCKCKGNDAVVLQWSVGGVLTSLSQAIEPVGGYTTESAAHSQCDARPTVTFPATEHHRPLAGTKLYCLVTEALAHVCEQLAQGRYVKRSGRDSNPRPTGCKSDVLPLRHHAALC